MVVMVLIIEVLHVAGVGEGSASILGGVCISDEAVQGIHSDRGPSQTALMDTQ
jgi:hypothetical protein